MTILPQLTITFILTICTPATHLNDYNFVLPEECSVHSSAKVSGAWCLRECLSMNLDVGRANENSTLLEAVLLVLVQQRLVLAHG